MNEQVIRIGTRESQLAVWQATQVSNLLSQQGYKNELVLIKSEGDINLTTPLYEMGVQGIFTRSLDIALLEKRIDIAVHSMKDVPVVLAKGIIQSAVLKRASDKDILVLKPGIELSQEWLSLGAAMPTINNEQSFAIATSSIRRKAQWLHRFPDSRIDNLRGNVNTRLQKLANSDWQGAIFAAAGLERIGLRPENSIELNWMLPAPAQGAIMVVCREEDQFAFEACRHFNDDDTAICTRAEKEFLKALMGGCSTPIAARASINNDVLLFKGNVLATDGSRQLEVELNVALKDANDIGTQAAQEIIAQGAKALLQKDVAITKSS